MLIPRHGAAQYKVGNLDAPQSANINTLIFLRALTSLFEADGQGAVVPYQDSIQSNYG